MTYSDVRRTRNIVVWPALGAQRRMALAMVLRDAGVLVASGTGIGVAGTLASRSILRAILLNTEPRTAAIDPMRALRAE